MTKSEPTLSLKLHATFTSGLTVNQATGSDNTAMTIIIFPEKGIKT